MSAKTKKRRNRGPRIDKSMRQLLQELDDEHFLLRRDLHFLVQESAVIRTIATRLRNLVCESAENDGLLWRMVDRLGVSDELELVAFESINRDAPLNKGLAFWKPPFGRPFQCPPFFPVEMHSLRKIIKTTEAIYVPSLHVERFTHQWLIKTAAEQVGVAHVDDGVSPALVKIAEVSVSGMSPLIETIALDAELTLQIGERVLDCAEAKGEHTRVTRSAPHGDLSVVLRLAPRESLGGRFQLTRISSDVSEVDVDCFVTPIGVEFEVTKRGTKIATIAAPYPPGWTPGETAVFALEYSSNRRQAVAMTNSIANAGSPHYCNIGWLEQRELRVDSFDEQLPELISSFFHKAQCAVFPSLLTPNELAHVLQESRSEKIGHLVL